MSYSAVKAKCLFCSSDAISQRQNIMPLHYLYDCPVCKVYFIQDKLLQMLPNFTSDSMEKINCIAENIHSNSKDSALTYWSNSPDDKIPELETDTATKVFEYVGRTPINHSEKPDNLLNQIAKILEKKPPFTWIKLSIADLYEIKIMDLAEAKVWALELETRGLILVRKNVGTDIIVSIHPLGWEQVFQNKKSINSKNVFIAMQFNWPDAEELRNQFLEAIKLGCLDCGYKADIVPQHHLEPITDKIIAGIKSSRFVVADFTFNNRGAYYEAGFARGFGVPVIHTIMDGHADGKPEEGKRLHFDIQQINYLKWSDPKEVRNKIRDRIKAVIE